MKMDIEITKDLESVEEGEKGEDLGCGEKDQENERDIESLTVLEVAERYPPKTWEALFTDAFDELELLSSIVERKEKNSGTFSPERKNLFRAFELCSIDNVKVVIFGQDPYPQMLADGKPKAQGLSFSISMEDNDIPVSLKHIFKEINDDLDIENYAHGDLTYWAQQGVLLLNACLTVTPGQPGSYNKIWMGFISKVLKHIAKHNEECIYVLWGREAQGLERLIEGSSMTVLTANHPAARGGMNNGFFGCKHFSQINVILAKQKKKEIDWRLPL
jgi:uracil-DNA glycosylase